MGKTVQRAGNGGAEESQWLTNSQFTVYIGSASYGFAKISNIAAEMEYDSIVEGGRNWSPLLFRKPRSRQDVLTLEKGVRVPGAAGKNVVSVGAVLSGLIISVGPDKDHCVRYTFDQGVVTKVELSGLDAKGSEIFIRKLEIAHTGLRRMTSEEK